MATALEDSVVRIEQKVDKLAEAVVTLARVEEKVAGLKEDHEKSFERMKEYAELTSSVFVGLIFGIAFHYLIDFAHIRFYCQLSICASMFSLILMLYISSQYEIEKYSEKKRKHYFRTKKRLSAQSADKKASRVNEISDTGTTVEHLHACHNTNMTSSSFLEVDASLSQPWIKVKTKRTSSWC